MKSYLRLSQRDMETILRNTATERGWDVLTIQFHYNEGSNRNDRFSVTLEVDIDNIKNDVI